VAIKRNQSDIESVEDDFASLSRLAASGAHEDVRLLLARLVRKYRQQRPTLAARLDQSLKASQTRFAGNSVLRRGTAAEPNDASLLIDSDTRLALIRVFDDRAGLAAPILPGNVHGAIISIILEHQERERLAARGICPTRSAILVGPPGVGKTFSARWIASALV
jgi:Cdc6-like AAA superfamily ATPase